MAQVTAGTSYEHTVEKSQDVLKLGMRKLSNPHYSSILLDNTNRWSKTTCWIKSLFCGFMCNITYFSSKVIKWPLCCWLVLGALLYLSSLTAGLHPGSWPFWYVTYEQLEKCHPEVEGCGAATIDDIIIGCCAIIKSPPSDVSYRGLWWIENTKEKALELPAGNAKIYKNTGIWATQLIICMCKRKLHTHRKMVSNWQSYFSEMMGIFILLLQSCSCE